MSETARDGYGTRFFFDNEEIRGVLDVSFSDATRATYETTTYSEEAPPGEAVRATKRAAAIVDGGSITLTVKYDPDNPVRHKQGGDPKTFSMRFLPKPGQIKGAEHSVGAILTTVGREFPMRDKMAQMLTFEFSGQETWVPGATDVKPVS